ncbi:hypothetical protein BJX70DRAFT_33227 [Aspergillus crustosus]
MTGQHAVVQAYRQLYRYSLKAVNYSTPARYQILQTLRSSFRSSPAQEFDSRKVTNTVHFLRKAADVVGTEHKILRNLLFIKHWDQPQMRRDTRPLRSLGIDQRDPRMRQDAREQFNRTLMLLNESLGTCLR